MRNLTDRRWIYLKAVLFVLGGVVSAGLILMDNPSLRTAALICVAIWCFARAYYFAFYVMQHYVDPGFRFSGLGAMLIHVLRGRVSR